MNWQGIAVTSLAVAMLFAATERLRRAGVPVEMTRGSAHILGAAVAVAFPLYLGLADVVFVGVLFTAVLATTAVRGGLRSIHAVQRPTLGAIALPVGGVLTALAVWSTPAAFAYAVLMLALADPFASAVGRLLRGPGWTAFGGHKTLAGSGAFFAIAFGLTAAFAGTIGPAVVAVALAITCVEAALGYGLDDLAIPVVSGLLGRALVGL